MMKIATNLSNVLFFNNLQQNFCSFFFYQPASIICQPLDMCKRKRVVSLLLVFTLLVNWIMIINIWENCSFSASNKLDLAPIVLHKLVNGSIFQYNTQEIKFIFLS